MKRFIIAIIIYSFTFCAKAQYYDIPYKNHSYSNVQDVDSITFTIHNGLPKMSIYEFKEVNSFIVMDVDTLYVVHKDLTRIPTFDGVTLSPDRCIPNTEITLSLNVKDKGENVYIYDTKIKVVNDANPRNDKTYKAIKGAFTLNNPTFKFAAPDSSGTYTVSVESKVSFSAGEVLYPTNQPPVQTTKLIVY